MPSDDSMSQDSLIKSSVAPPSDGIMDFRPAQMGYFMPAEWERHDRCWMAWPTNRSLWLDHIESARRAYAEVANTILRHEPVTMVVRPDDVPRAKELLDAAVSILPLPLQDGWMRDIGPQFVINPQNRSIAGVDWGFNGWGHHYTPYDKNARIAREVLIAASEKMQRFVAPMILEGGSVHVDGDKTALATAECLLNGDRNPHLTQADIEHCLGEYLNIEKVIWIPNGLFDDLTDGHVDNVACFVAPGVVLAATTENTKDPNYPRLQANVQALKQAVDAQGRKLQVHTVNLPDKIIYFQETRLPMSYVNFYIANDAIILPLFDDAQDQSALSTVSQLFPDRKVETVAGTPITYGGGCVHCITQQQPVIGK